MPFPLIPVVLGALFVGSGVGLVKHYNKPRHERDAANRRANQLALQMFGVVFEQLSQAESRQVIAKMRQEALR